MKHITLVLMLLLLISINPAPTQAQTNLPNINCDIFPANHIFNTRLDTLLAGGQITTDPRNGTWRSAIGGGTRLFVDFGDVVWPPGSDQPIGMPYNVVNASQADVQIIYDQYGDDSDPGPMPIPPTALREGGPTVAGGDRHMLVVDDEDCFLYELWASSKNPNNSWTAGSGAVFDLMSNWLRPLGWTSGDAAGLPILPFLPRYQDILEGEMRHAVRFTLSCTAQAYTWPARHGAGSSGCSNRPPMGQIFLLRADYPTAGMSAAGQIIATGMKRYGLILADNGSNGYIQGTHDPRWDIEELKDDLNQITFNDLTAVNICKLRVNADSGAAAINANPSGTGCEYPQSTKTNGGYVRGRVRDPLGNPLVGITVSAGAFGNSITDSTGTYLIDAITRNQNFVVRADGISLGYGEMWWDNSLTSGGATNLQVSSTLTAALYKNFVMGQYEDVTGTVYGANGVTPLPNVPVRVHGTNTVVCTNGSGQYTLSLLVGPAHKIGAGGVHASCTDSTRPLRWYMNSQSPTSAQGVIAPSTGINFTLPALITYEMNEQLFLDHLQTSSVAMGSAIYPLVIDISPANTVITFINADNTTGTATVSLIPNGGLIEIRITATTGTFSGAMYRDLPQMMMDAFDAVLATTNLNGDALEDVVITVNSVIFRAVN
ncbi:MAG: hypothetical protein MUE54_10835 [Anaerolineae bacterium]|nr:hypothetical protein [Anaerolineae bacterium]